MDRLLTKVSDVLATVSGWTNAALDGAAAVSAGAGLSAAWTWWTGLFDAYAWTDIGALVAPVLVLVTAGMFWAITRLHLQG